jgi:outer membrane protein OmpA-like peptidoglycan-associated protein
VVSQALGTQKGDVMMTRTKRLGVLGGLFALLLATACGSSSQTPRELRDARAAYNRAQSGPAQQLKPAELHEAQVALQRAERAYEDDAESAETRDIAYVAERKAQLAEIEAATLAVQREAARQASAQADAARSAQSQLHQTHAQLEQERQARMAAEARAKDAFSRLAGVKEDARGTIITLPGAVLFATGKSELKPAAQTRLDDVAEALSGQPLERKMVIEGHTDSTGSAERNQVLSQERADAVRTYLISKGVAAESLAAEGKGPSTPIADNSTTEGRATNRRVEIVVQPLAEPQ